MSKNVSNAPIVVSGVGKTANVYVIQPENTGTQAEAQRNVNKAIATVSMIFILALAMTLCLRAERTNVAAETITAVAQAIAPKVRDPDKSVAAIVDETSAALFPTAMSGASIEGFRRLVQVVAFRLEGMGAPDLDDADIRAGFLKETREELLKNLAVVSLLHAGLLLIFPAFFTMTVLTARRHLRNYATDGSAKRLDTFWNAAWWRRHHEFLKEESKWFLGRRFGFAILVSLSLLYMFAPAGLLATTIGEYVNLHAIPGGTSQPYWFSRFDQVSPFVLGLAGFLLYAMIVFARRVVTVDVSNRLFLSLWNRGITVAVLSLVLTTVDEGSTISKALIFIAGVFPDAGLRAIAKLAKTGTDKLTNTEPRGFEGVPEIDSLREGSLRELGIFDTADLARADLPHDLMTTSRIDPRALLKAVDRALLLEQLGEAASKLGKLPVFTASELVLFAYGRDAYAGRWEGFAQAPAKEHAPVLDDGQKAARCAAINAALEVQDATIHLDRLRQNLNLKFILDNQLFYPDT